MAFSVVTSPISAEVLERARRAGFPRRAPPLAGQARFEMSWSPSDAGKTYPDHRLCPRPVSPSPVLLK